uniref:Uncharacterized protein n=1 Tax=uncultured marine group II/III euryarchaeote KM3_113_E08 TaxID=1457853 RepID=A0A075GCZ1_9EURY|nr:hypothetical protein [uncultured marine group II/III euryarchaeote KM3_113_E08]
MRSQSRVDQSTINCLLRPGLSGSGIITNHHHHHQDRRRNGGSVSKCQNEEKSPSNFSNDSHFLEEPFRLVSNILKPQLSSFRFRLDWPIKRAKIVNKTNTKIEISREAKGLPATTLGGL